MTLSIALGARATMLDGFEIFLVIGSAASTLTLFQSNLSLCVFNLGVASTGTPFGAATNDSIALASGTFTVPILNTGTAVAGNANRFVIQGQSTTDALSGTVSTIGGGGDIQIPSVAVTAALTQRLNALVLRMASSGALTVEASLTLV